MAGVTEAGRPREGLAGGPFGTLARAQYQALAAMRWRSFKNTLRSGKGAAELGATVVAYSLYSLMGLGLAGAMGGGAYAVASSGKWIIMAALFWAVFIVWQVVPVSIASFQEQFDPGGLLRFPVSFGTFVMLHIIFGLVDASSIVGGACCVGIWVGVVIARPDLAGWMAVTLAGFAVFNVLLVRAVFAWIDRWLAQRRTREIVSGLFLVLVLGAQLLNPAFHSHRSGGMMGTQSRAENMRRLHSAAEIQKWLPAGMAGLAIERAVEHRPSQGLEALAGLGVYIFGAGGVLAVRLRAGYRGENLSDAPARSKQVQRRRAHFGGGSGPIAAVMEKELRTLLRSLPLLYGLGAPLFMVFVFSGVFVKHGAAGGRAPSMALMVSLAYAVVGFTQLFYNNLGPEGPAVQLLFLSPTPVRTVILAKNLFHAGLFAVVAVLVCSIAILRLGAPEAAALAGTLAWLLFALPLHLAVGNIFSLMMPYRLNLGRIARQRGSQASALLSMAVQAGVLGIGVGVFALFGYFSRLWLAVPVFLVLAAGAVFGWVRILGRANEMANARRELLLTALVKAD